MCLVSITCCVLQTGDDVTLTSHRDDITPAEMLLWSMNILSTVYAEQLAVFRTPLHISTRNLRTY